MRLASWLSMFAVALAPALARADVAPDPPDYWKPCQGLKLGDACTVVETEDDGACVEKECQADPTKKCLFCQIGATPTSSTSGDPEPAKDGCDCRSGGAPGGALALLGLLLVRRRRMS